MSKNGFEVVAVEPVAVVDVREKSRYEAAVAVAQRNPRSISDFMDGSKALITRNEAIAAGCNYAVPRAGKQIPGPSIRLAEIAVTQYKNIIVRSYTSREDENFVYAVGEAVDLESNVAVSVESSRSIRKSNGERFNQDMIKNTMGVAKSIAYREAAFRLIPKVLITELSETAKQVVVGDMQSIESRREGAMVTLGQMGVTDERVFAKLEIVGIDDMGPDELTILRGYVESIRAGDEEVELVFPDVRAPVRNAEDILDTLEGRKPAANPKAPAKGEKKPPPKKEPPAGPPQGDTCENCGEIAVLASFNGKKLCAKCRKNKDLF